VLYRFFIAAALNTDFMGLKAQDLNLVTAVLVALALLVPGYKRIAFWLPRRHANPVRKEAR
jgi:putative ABC transport system permease protein